MTVFDVARRIPFREGTIRVICKQVKVCGSQSIHIFLTCKWSCRMVVIATGGTPLYPYDRRFFKLEKILRVSMLLSQCNNIRRKFPYLILPYNLNMVVRCGQSFMYTSCIPSNHCSVPRLNYAQD